MRARSLVFSFLTMLSLAGTAVAHSPDTSYCRITIRPLEVHFAFTYDIATLQRIVTLDTDKDDHVSRAELESAAPAIRRFLRQHIYLDLNQREADFAEEEPPTAANDPGTAIPKSDYAQRLVTFTFRNPVLSAPEDVTITFDFFRTAGRGSYRAGCVRLERARGRSHLHPVRAGLLV
jgi:hypothetical protein